MLLILAVFWPRLSYPLLEPDEARNAQIALEMYQSGDWVSLTRKGRPYMDKPPLLFWSISTCYRLFGPSPFAARLPVALAATLTVLVTYLLGTSLVGTRAALWGTVVLATSIGFILPGRYIIHDMFLTFFVTCTLSLLWLAEALPRSVARSICWAAAGVACGLGTLTKGPVAVVLTVPPLLLFDWLKWGKLRSRISEWGLFAGALIVTAAPWYVLATLRNKQFLEYFVWKQNISRFLHGSNHPAPWWFYIPVVFAGMFPASLLLPPAAVYLFTRRRVFRERRPATLGFVFLAACWPLLFFSLSGGKLPTYILPAAPLLSLLIGQMIHSVLVPAGPLATRQLPLYLKDVRLHFPTVLLALSVTAVPVCLGIDFALGQLRFSNGLLLSAFTLVLSTLWVVDRRWWIRRPVRWGLAAGAAVVAVSVVFNDVFPNVAVCRSYLAHTAERVAAVPALAHNRSVPLVFFGRDRDSAALYFPGRPIQELKSNDFDRLISFLEAHPQVVLVAEPHDTRKVKRRLQNLPFQIQPLSDCVLWIRRAETDSTTKSAFRSRLSPFQRAHSEFKCSGRNNENRSA